MPSGGGESAWCIFPHWTRPTPRCTRRRRCHGACDDRRWSQSCRLRLWARCRCQWLDGRPAPAADFSSRPAPPLGAHLPAPRPPGAARRPPGDERAPPPSPPPGPSTRRRARRPQRREGEGTGAATPSRAQKKFHCPTRWEMERRAPLPAPRATRLCARPRSFLSVSVTLSEQAAERPLGQWPAAGGRRDADQRWRRCRSADRSAACPPTVRRQAQSRRVFVASISQWSRCVWLIWSIGFRNGRGLSADPIRQRDQTARSDQSDDRRQTTDRRRVAEGGGRRVGRG